MYVKLSTPNSFGEYLHSLKDKSGLTWREIANAVGLRWGETMVKYVNDLKIPGWSTFLNLCAWGDQYGFSFPELVKAYLPKVYQTARQRNVHLIFHVILPTDFDCTTFARQNPQQFLVSAGKLSEITDMCLLCISNWRNSANDDNEVLAHCKELAQFAADTRAAARKIIDFWRQNTPDSRERDIALQRYCFGMKTEELSAIWGINVRWINRLSDRAVACFLEQIAHSIKSEIRL